MGAVKFCEYIKAYFKARKDERIARGGSSVAARNAIIIALISAGAAIGVALIALLKETQ
jgi:hypothetical protein